MHCRFCGSHSLRQTHHGVSHPRRREYGPFDLYVCRDCGSLATWPAPSPESLSELYGSFAAGVEGSLRELRQQTPLTAWFTRIVDRTARSGVTRWLDVGAGGGELAALLAARYPDAVGMAFDFAPRPEALDARVQWRQADLNAAFEAPQADLVISVSVWEHVLDPSAYLAHLVSLVAPGGTLYLVCPDAGSLAARVLGTRWPYFLPGEHLNMPTRAGARRCLERVVGDSGRTGAAIEVHRIGLPYPPAYVLGFLGLDRAARWARKLPPVPLPVGALEAIYRPASP